MTCLWEISGVGEVRWVDSELGCNLCRPLLCILANVVLVFGHFVELRLGVLSSLQHSNSLGAKPFYFHVNGVVYYRSSFLGFRSLYDLVVIFSSLHSSQYLA